MLLRRLNMMNWLKELKTKYIEVKTKLDDLEIQVKLIPTKEQKI